MKGDKKSVEQDGVAAKAEADKHAPGQCDYCDAVTEAMADVTLDIGVPGMVPAARAENKGGGSEPRRLLTVA